jgi:heme exporter protein A
MPLGEVDLSQDLPALEAKRLTKHFGRIAVLKEIDIALEPNRCHVLFGRNGAGKSTFLSIAATLMKPSSGEILYGGESLTKLGERIRHRIGLVSHQSFTYPDLTVEENLYFYARIYGISGKIDEALTWADLDLRRRSPVRSLSRGMLQRLAIARALLHEPRLLLLDEPYTGLDALSAERLSDRIVALKNGTTIVLTTHDIERGVSVADRMLVMEAGRIAFDATGGTTKEVRRVLLEVQEATR